MEYKKTRNKRMQRYKDTMTQGYKDTRIQIYTSTRIQKYINKHRISIKKTFNAKRMQ